MKPDGLTAYDSSSSGHDGSLINMDASDWISGRIDNCLGFDGIDDYQERRNISDGQWHHVAVVVPEMPSVTILMYNSISMVNRRPWLPQQAR